MASATGMPGPSYGPDLPLPGGRDGESNAEREARRMSVRLAVAQRRLRQPSQPTIVPTTPVFEEISDSMGLGDLTVVHGVLRRVRVLRRQPRDQR